MCDYDLKTSTMERPGPEWSCCATGVGGWGGVSGGGGGGGISDVVFDLPGLCSPE